MARIQGGEFVMRDARTSSTRAVAVESFRLSATPVTVAQFSEVQIGHATDDSVSAPVRGVSWIEAVRWCNTASIAENLDPAYRIGCATVFWDVGSDGYRLPAEAEWEWACRAGTEGPRYGEVGDIAWTEKDGLDGPAPVATKQPNAFGLYDMLGNVWEWCWDYADPARYADYCSLRGGGWADKTWSCRASVRRGSMPTARLDDVGFRVARGAMEPSGDDEVQGWSHQRDVARASITGPIPYGWTPLREIT